MELTLEGVEEEDEDQILESSEGEEGLEYDDEDEGLPEEDILSRPTQFGYKCLRKQSRHCHAFPSFRDLYLFGYSLLW